MSPHLLLQYLPSLKMCLQCTTLTKKRNIPTFVDWPFQIRPYIPLVRVQVSAKEIK